MFTIFGCILIFLCVAYLLCCSLIKRFECKKIIITALIIFCISIMFIYYDNIEEISIKDYLKIKIAKEQAYTDLEIIDSLKTQMENDAYELFELKVKLDSMFTFGPEGIVPQKAFNIGNLQLTEDGGVMTLADMNVTAETSDGDVMSYAFKIDANSIMVVKVESDGKGGTKNKKVEYNGDLEILDPDNGVILTSSNGSKWLLKVKNSGELDITKF